MGKNIKSVAQNNIGYTGIVKLSQYTGGKKFSIAEIHNVGGKPLFNFLVDCLMGNFKEAAANRPVKIMLLNVEGTGENTTIKAATDTGLISLLNAPEKLYSATEGIVRYSFMIPQEYFANNSRFNAIGLYPGYVTKPSEAGDFAAYCLVDRSDWDISISSVLVLDWELHIANNFK
jgi:hypothetical protein